MKSRFSCFDFLRGGRVEAVLRITIDREGRLSNHRRGKTCKRARRLLRLLTAGYGTKQTYRCEFAHVRFRSEAGKHRIVASSASVVNDGHHRGVGSGKP